MHIEEVQLQQMLNQAAEEGAKRALAAIGLHDEHAASDLRSLRGLLETWRDMQKVAVQTFIRIVVVGVMGLFAASTLATSIGRMWRGE